MKTILSALLGFALLLTGCETFNNLNPNTQAVLKAGAKLALSFGLAELSDRVKEVRPYKDKLNTLFETTFSQASAPAAIGAQLKAGVVKVVPPELQAVVIEKLKSSLQDKTAAAAPGAATYNQTIAGNL